MYKFMDQETALKKALRTERKAGRQEGTRQQLEKDAKGMYKEGLKPEAIARIQGISVEDVEAILGLQPV